jgi:hypothetical protein
MYEIRSDISPPLWGIRNKYPWRELAVGDSFFVPCVSTQTLSNAAHQISRRHHELKFICRTEAGGVRVWRVI